MIDQKFETFVLDGDAAKHIVYDPDHIIAGDTDSSYIDLGTKFPPGFDDVDVVVKFADDLGEYVNSTFPNMMETLFNVPVDRQGIMTTEREVVSDKSVFFGKKKYVMHVINMEGKSVDKNKMMGVEIIKSDTPKVIQDFLKDIVEMMLDNKTFEEIISFVMDFKKQYYSMGIIDIGVPKTLKTLKKYEAVVERNMIDVKTVKTMFSERVVGNPYKDVPQHAKAAIFYNSMCGPSDKKINAGDKIKIVYIKHDTPDVIAIPTDMEEEEIPSFLNNFVIDYDTMWEKVMNKIDLYLTPIGMDAASRKEQHTKRMFFGEK